MASDTETERMAALKRAYADVILSTATESAARILKSERRAQRFQQSILAAKEEALATLLRLKSVMDSKLKEAENTSSSQVRRIQELEGQLNEADRTIVSLREELERANNKLRKTKNGFVDPSSGQHTDSGNLSTVKSINIIQKNKDGDSLIDLNAKTGERNPTDISSILMRSNESELYRNGCTQRIRAFEHNVLNAEVPEEQRLDGQIQDLMNESNITENEIPGRPKSVKVLTKEANNPAESEGKNVEKSSSSCNGHTVKVFQRVLPKKPRTRFNQSKANGHVISHESSDVEGYKNSGVLLVTKSINDEPPHKMLKSEDRMFSNKNSGLLKCNNGTLTEQIDMKQKLNCQNENREDLDEKRDRAKDAISSGILLTNQTVGVNTEEIFDVSDMKHVGKEKFLKYTFQRTRKRGSSNIKNESILAEKTIPERESEDTPDVLLEPLKCPLVAELPRDNRRIIQVARQLISLSEKKW